MRAVQVLRSRSDLPRERHRTGSSIVFYNSLMEPTEFTAAAARTARRFNMDLSRSLVMVSGGPDSVALLRALVELETRPVVLHVAHGLRGEESLTDAKFVRELCEGLGLVYEERRARLEEGNLQEEAREERYRFAERLADERELSAIATGHTADDVAETVLLNLARGAGLRGLASIPPVRGRIVRPLIHHRRRDVLRFLEHLDQPYRTDPTNLTPKYARNRVRLEVLPVLEELYPGAGSNIAHNASLLRDDLERRPLALRRHAVRRAYATLVPDGMPLGSTTVETVLELARKKEGTRTIHLPRNVVAAVRYGEELAFYRRVEHETEQPPEVRDLLVGQQYFHGWHIDVREVRGYDPEDAIRPEVAYLDASRGPYRVRFAREGDTIRPLGLGGTKKVMRAMMDRKVPKDLRERTPVVVDAPGKVAWIFF